MVRGHLNPKTLHWRGKDIFWISKMFFCVFVGQTYMYFMFPRGRYWHIKKILQDVYPVVCETNVRES